LYRIGFTSMNKRLQTLLEIEHLSPSQLADALSIQRGGISHLLSGRNKPSFDFLQKVLEKYPDISAEWLITGKGKPVKGFMGENNRSVTIDNSSQKHNIQNNNKDINLFSQSASNTQDSTDTTLSASHAAVACANVSTPGTVLTIENTNQTPPRSVKRIILYYSDGTYADFYPDSN